MYNRYYNMVCKCDCGNKVERKYYQILNIEKPSCGCYAREIHSKQMSEEILSKFKIIEIKISILLKMVRKLILDQDMK